MMKTPEVLEAAAKAKAAGATRFCMGAAWREVKDGPAFDEVLEMVRGVRALGMEACATLGMLTEPQAERLAEAGLTAYNHNLDTSRAYYKSIITTRTYDDRLTTLERVRKAGITVCCGGIIGMGESLDDRCSLLVDAGQPRPAAGERAGQRAGADVRDAARRARARRPAGAGADDRDRAHPDAEGARAPVGRAAGADARGAGALLSGRRELDLLRREAADHRKPRRRAPTSACCATPGFARAPRTRTPCGNP